MTIKISHLSTRDQLEKAKIAWLELERKSKHKSICTSFYWVINWWDSFHTINNNQVGNNKQLFIICVYDDEELIFVLPLVKLYRKKFGLSVSFIEFIGQQWSGVYCDAITTQEDKIVVKKAEKYLFDNLKFDCFYLRFFTNDSLFHNKYSQEFASCPEINIGGHSSFDDYCKENYSKRQKQNLRTGTNRAVKDGALLTSSVEEITNENLEHIVRISKSKLTDNKSWLYGDKCKSNFYRAIYSDFDSNVIFISIDGVKVAYRANLFLNGMKLCLDASFDRDAPNYELGIKSVNANIQDTFDKNISTHSLGPGLDPYKLKFTKVFTSLFYNVKKGNTIKSSVVIRLLKALLNDTKNN